ncbi:prepilin peptidase [Neorhodopirellula pilleata]|nr:A24 family peptidase [Neorhodopirellula pilleata]
MSTLAKNTVLPFSMPDFESHPYRTFAIGCVVGGCIWASVLPVNWTLGGVAGFVVLALLATTTVLDLQFRRIPNWATYSAFVIGIGLNVIAHFAENWSAWLGAVGLGSSLGGGLGMLAIMFVIFSLSGGGAGDVKLAASLGTLLGWDMILQAMLYSFIVAGAALACYAIWTIGPLELFIACFRSIGCRLAPGMIAPPPSQHRVLLKKQFPLAPFFTSGVLIAALL